MFRFGVFNKWQRPNGIKKKQNALPQLGWLADPAILLRTHIRRVVQPQNWKPSFVIEVEDLIGCKLFHKPTLTSD